MPSTHAEWDILTPHGLPWLCRTGPAHTSTHQLQSRMPAYMHAESHTYSHSSAGTWMGLSSVPKRGSYALHKRRNTACTVHSRTGLLSRWQAEAHAALLSAVAYALLCCLAQARRVNSSPGEVRPVHCTATSPICAIPDVSCSTSTFNMPVVVHSAHCNRQPVAVPVAVC